MHKNSLQIMQKFVKDYLPDRKMKILDIGSRIIPNQTEIGSYRKYFIHKKWQYIGVDVEAGENVDIVMTDNNKFPFKSGEFEVVISGQTIEHVEYPWVFFKEIERVLKKDGLCCIIAPAKLHEHRYPIDTFRYYPDGMRALAKYSNLKVLEVKRIVVDIKAEDTYLIAKKI